MDYGSEEYEIVRRALLAAAPDPHEITITDWENRILDEFLPLPEHQQLFLENILREMASFGQGMYSKDLFSMSRTGRDFIDIVRRFLHPPEQIKKPRAPVAFPCSVSEKGPEKFQKWEEAPTAPRAPFREIVSNGMSFGHHLLIPVG